MPVFVDQLNRNINILSLPVRIISLVPSVTELLFDLELEDDVVGITKFCIHPEHWHKNKTRVGGTKNININTIKTLWPDLIIANKEENVKEQIEELEKMFPVWISDVSDYNSALQMIAMLGEIVGKTTKATSIIERINKNFSQIPITDKIFAAVYLIWKDPYMTIGGDTFINDMLLKAGFRNLFEDTSRYPVISIEEIQRINPEVILFSTEPYPFKEKHLAEFKALLPNTKMILADGEIFSWYGSRMIYAADYFKELNK